MYKYLAFLCVVSLLSACESTSVPKSKNDNAAALNKTSTQILGGTVYYTGYDGTNDFTLLVSTSRELEIMDETVATAVRQSFPVDQTVVDELIAEYKAIDPTLSANREQRLRERLQTATAWRITPNGPGITTIKATRSQNGTVDPESVWQNAEIRTLVVESYSSNQVAVGQQRYNANGSGCKGCHGTGEFDAPTHQLGRVIEISDENAIQWISTGKTLDRIANLSHAWNFANDAEKQATVAYLRTQQTKDVKELARLLFNERLEELKQNNVQ